MAVAVHRPNNCLSDRRINGGESRVAAVSGVQFHRHSAGGRTTLTNSL
jgi:hypothetical protein